VNFLQPCLQLSKTVRRALAGSMLAGVVLAGSGLLPQQASETYAAAAPIYWGAYVDGAPFDTSKIDTFESHAGKKQSIVHWGEPWRMNGQMMKFQTAEFEKVRLRGQIPMLDWNSWDLSHQADDPNFKLSKISGGVYDAYITQWATDAKNWGHPFFLRFDHEMNGWWYVWSEQRNGNQPGDYVKAWRHVVDIFRKVGANNVSWVWCINITDSRSTPITSMYPGDSYVDWLAMDGYNKATDSASFFQFDQIFSAHPWSKKNTYGELVSLSPKKPIMVAETATSKTGGDAGQWIKNMFSVLQSGKYPNVKALVWFNWNAGSTANAWPIESSAAQQAGFKAGVASSYYATNTFKDLPAGKIQPIGGPIGGTTTPAPTPVPTQPAAPTPAPTQPATQPTPVPTQPATTPTSSTLPASGTLTLKAIGDTYTDASNPTSVAGGPSLVLKANGSPDQNAYLKFDLTPLKGKTIDTTVLRIHTTADAGAGSATIYDVARLDGADQNSWNGSTTNYTNAPATGLRLGGMNASGGNAWYQSALAHAGVQPYAGTMLNLVIGHSSTTDNLIFNSKDGDQSLAPQLIVTYH
jgi:mannan endo-1,4-beta-mannosidase